VWEIRFGDSAYRIKEFATEEQAAAYVSYLNGGERPPEA
jgi:hypothetical protein